MRTDLHLLQIFKKHLKIHYWLLLIIVLSAIEVKSQSPNLIKFTTANPDGQYNTGDVIRLEAYFDEWLSSPSYLKAKLNTGDTVQFNFIVNEAKDFVIPFGTPSQSNWDFSGEYNKGVNRIFELKHGSNNGKVLIAGEALDYEGDPDADYMVITNKDGTLAHKFNFNGMVQWAVELSDGGIVAGGAFTNYNGNGNYDYLIKFNSDFTIDTNWMSKYTQNKLSERIGGMATGPSGAGLSDNCIVEDPDDLGAIYVCGYFNSPRRGLVKYNANGAMDSGFNPGWGSTDLNVSSVAVDESHIWATGVTSPGRNADTHLYKLDKSNGSNASGYTRPDFQGYQWAGPMGLLVMPEPADGGPGGVLWLGRSGADNRNSKVVGGGVTTSDRHVVSIQDNGSVTSPSVFNVENAFHQNNVWGVDGSALLKGKLWLAYHLQGSGGGKYITQGSSVNEGILAVLKLDGTFHDPLNNTWSVPSNGSVNDGFNLGAYDGMTLSTTEDGNLFIGGNFTAVAGTNSQDYKGHALVSFQRAHGNYTVSAEDRVDQLKVVEILDYSTTDMYGESDGTSVLPTNPDCIFENNHTISVNMPYTEDTGRFITKWKTTSANETITIPTTGTGYDCYVIWDETKPDEVEYFTGGSPTISHTFATAGTYTIKIAGDFPRIYFNDTGDKDKIQSIEQWGDIQWSSMSHAFKGCSKLQVNATDNPDLSNVSSLESMFAECSSLTGHSSMGNWHLYSVKKLSRMFQNAKQFDVNLNYWFNQGVNGWDAVNVQFMSYMFAGAESFNSELSSWDVGNVFSMAGMFYGATSFNQNIGSWDVENVTSMGDMFFGAVDFNQDISSWKVDSVSNMGNMFRDASAFNQDISSWSISSLTTALKMLDNSGMSISNYDKLLIAWNDSVQVSLADGDPLNDKTNIEFGAAGIQYCAGTNARKALIDKGWGDGTAGEADSDGDYLDIIDGGTAYPINTYTLNSDFSICTGASAALNLSGSEPNVNYQLYTGDDSPVGTPVAGTGSAIAFTVTPTENTSYYVIATSTLTPPHAKPG